MLAPNECFRTFASGWISFKDYFHIIINTPPYVTVVSESIMQRDKNEQPALSKRDESKVSLMDFLPQIL